MRLKAWKRAGSTRGAAAAPPPSRDIETSVGGAPDEGRPSAGLALCHLLRMMAYEPATIRAPGGTLARMRPFVDGARLQLQARREAGGTKEEHAEELARLMEGAVAGLCHVARFWADGAPDSVVAPFAAASAGGPGSACELLFLVPENAEARERAERMIAFALSGLAELGFSVNHASCTASGAAQLAEALPSIGASLRNARIVWGCYGLYAALADHLPKPTETSRSEAA